MSKADRAEALFCSKRGIPLDVWKGMDGESRRAFGRKFPSVMWVPNRAQDRAGSGTWSCGPYPRIHLVTFGNGTGKTDWLGEMLCGIVKGPKWVNQRYCNFDFFRDLTPKRQDGTLTVWWVCDSDLMKQNGPDYKTIRAHIPDAQFKAKSNSGVFSEIHIPVINYEGKPSKIVVAVKTHGEDAGSYAGENVDVIICDEPPKEEHWSEMVGRLRSKVGDVGARIIIGGTPLKLAGFLYDLIEDPEFEGKVKHSTGSLWENCAGKELPEEEAKRLGIEIDPETGVYDTRGHLTLESIRDQIKLWSKSKDPDELKSRVDGEFTHIAGRIYKVFNRDVHVIKPYNIPSKYPIVMVADPHDSRPDVAGWYMVTPRNKVVCIAEYPNKPYEMCTSRSETVPETCETWRMMESEMGIENQVVGRFGDPNKFLDPDPYTGKTYQQLYAEHDFKFSVSVNDRLEYGHEMVRQFLAYDKEMFELYNGDPLYQPRMLFFDICNNHIQYMTKYSTKTSKDPSIVREDVDQKWKDFCDIVRYMIVTFRPFENLSIDRKKSEWAAIKKARSPYDQSQTEYKGRRIVSPKVFA